MWAAQYTLRTIGEFRSADELNSVVVANRNGVQMLLKDIATIDDGGDNQDMIVRVDGKPGVIMSIQKQSDANTVQVADAVYRTMEELRRRYPEINVRSINDSSTFIRLTVQNVVNNGLWWSAGRADPFDLFAEHPQHIDCRNRNSSFHCLYFYPH